MIHGRILRAAATVKQDANAMMRASTDAQPARLPYFCECNDTDCLRAVWLSPAEYDRRKAESAASVLSEEHNRPLAAVS